VRRGLVLVLSPARLFARGAAYRPVCYELRSVPTRDETAGIDLTVMHARPLWEVTTIGHDSLDVAAKRSPREAGRTRAIKGKTIRPALALRTPCGHEFFGIAIHTSKYLMLLVPQTGFEPVTPSLRMTCSTN
jgi:hypothetical protein